MGEAGFGQGSGNLWTILFTTGTKSRWSLAALQGNDLPGADAFIGGKADAQGLHGIAGGAGQVQILGDGAQHEGLLQIAQTLMAGIAGVSDQAVTAGTVALRP